MSKQIPLPPFKAFLASNIPSVYDNTLSYYDELTKLIAYLDQIVPVVNANTEGLKELREYVNNYFKNLDVQEEINNKLDDMADKGELAAIIAQFLSTAPVFGYATIADMAAATNLIAGSIARTLGKTSAATGDGAFYKVRAIEESDTPDGVNLVAISGTSLVAEIIPDYANSVLQAEINKINAKKTHDIKFVGNDEAYYPEYELRSTVNGLGFEPVITRGGGDAEIGIQGVALWKKTGQLVCVNGSEIYTLKQNNNSTKTTLWSGTYGHGGDCCIIGDDLFIADSGNTAVYKVDLNTGDKTTYVISAASIKNATENYTPVLAGVCTDDGNLLYLAVCDEENNDHTIKSNSTVRLYTFDTNTNDIAKIFEMAQDTCYLQGLSKDAQYFYISGNKPFTTDYAGNILTIVDAETLNVYDKLANNSDYEFEGLDYGAFEGMEGLITVCAKYGSRYSFGVYSFYGNQSKQRTLYNTDSIKAYTTKSRDGFVMLFFTIYDTFAEGEGTYQYDNFFENAFPIYAGGSNSDFSPIPLSGSTRYFNGYAQWTYNDVRNRLKVYVRTGSAAATSINGVITYRSN